MTQRIRLTPYKIPESKTEVPKIGEELLNSSGDKEVNIGTGEVQETVTAVIKEEEEEEVDTTGTKEVKTNKNYYKKLGDWVDKHTKEIYIALGITLTGLGVLAIDKQYPEAFNFDTEPEKIGLVDNQAVLNKTMDEKYSSLIETYDKYKKGRKELPNNTTIETDRMFRYIFKKENGFTVYIDNIGISDGLLLKDSQGKNLFEIKKGLNGDWYFVKDNTFYPINTAAISIFEHLVD
jgi:hypothetical protein